MDSVTISKAILKASSPELDWLDPNHRVKKTSNLDKKQDFGSTAVGISDSTFLLRISCIMDCRLVPLGWLQGFTGCQICLVTIVMQRIACWVE